MNKVSAEDDPKRSELVKVRQSVPHKDDDGRKLFTVTDTYNTKSTSRSLRGRDFTLSRPASRVKSGQVKWRKTIVSVLCCVVLCRAVPQPAAIFQGQGSSLAFGVLAGGGKAE